MSRVSVLSKYPDYELTIGIEVHVQLSTKTKIFCGCSNAQVDEPNTTICHICAGYPGVLPVLNKEVVVGAIKAGLATNCTINPKSEFARKHYFYPDLPKGYQTTQDDKPVCSEGFVEIRLDNGSTKKIRLIRIHMEEDAGKNVHAADSNESFVDLNRAGTPLLEIVSYPDISSTEEAQEYLKTLHRIVTYLGICSGNMEEGAFRADTNVSVKKKGATKLGTRCELKNINSFKFIGDAIEYEAERQIKLLEAGERVVQQTRLWDTKERKTVAMRSKEDAADYRYFADPDLPYVVISNEWIAEVEKSLPELPHQKFARLCSEYDLTPYEADILIDNVEVASYYEQAARLIKSKLLINWILRDVMGYVKENKISLVDLKVTPERLAALIALIEKGTINARAAQEVFEVIAQTGEEPLAIVKARGLEQMDNSAELEELIKRLVQAHPQQAADYKAGKEKLFGFFVGKAMAETKGRGNPQTINDLLKKYLA